MSLSAELRGVATFLTRLNATPRKVDAAVGRSMDVVGRELERFVRAEELSGQKLTVRTGNLRRAVFHAVGANADGRYVRVGVDAKKAKYGPAQELGGTIRPKNTRWLAIPLDAVRTNKGVARFRARDLRANPSAFGFVGTFVRDHVIFGRRSDRSITPLFVLKESVTLKAVGFMANAARVKREWVQKTIGDAARKAFKEAVGGS